MNKKQYIIDSLEELGIDYSIDASFFKVGQETIIFDFYIKKPHKLVIIYKEPHKKIDSILGAGFTILDFSKIDPNFDIINNTLTSSPYS